jgi:hypothetical protein
MPIKSNLFSHEETEKTEKTASKWLIPERTLVNSLFSPFPHVRKDSIFKALVALNAFCKSLDWICSRIESVEMEMPE